METTTPPLTGIFEIDHVHSTVEFAVSHIVSTFRASFKDIEGRLVLDGDETELAAMAKVESVTIAAPSDFRQHVVYGDDFFNADAYPQITFRSTNVRLGNDGSASAAGELTIRDITRAIAAEGSFNGPTHDPFGGERDPIRLRTKVDRREWDLNWQLALPQGGNAVGWEVELTAELELVRSSAR